jgi:hypothetical protein
LVYQILKARQPDWLPRWVEKELDGRDTCDWTILRRFMRDKLCPKPQSENYIIKMVHQLPGYSHIDGMTLANKLRADPELLDDEVWRIFETNPVSETLLPDMSFGENVHSWEGALAELAAEGRLDRARLLQASLETLTGGLQPKNTGWFWKLHEHLKPTLEERRTLQPLYLRLLANPVAPVAKFALDALAELAGAKQLDVRSLADAVGPVFALRPKGQPLTALRLLKQAAQQDPSAHSRVVAAVVFALAHEKPEVQEAALELIEEFSAGAKAEVPAELASYQDGVAPSLQTRLRALLSRTADLPPPATETPALADDLREQAKTVPAPWRDLAGIDALLRALEGSGRIEPVACDPMAVPRCAPDTYLKPIQDLDELIEGLSAAIEGMQDADELERLLDGLSRLGAQRPDDFQARSAPLLYRVKQLSTPGQYPLTWPILGLLRVIRCWCEPVVPPGDTNPERNQGVLWFLAHRLRELSLRLQQGRAAPLLGCPTHRHGWIAPHAFVRRLQEWHTRQLEPDSHDFIQGLLRLAPEGRAQALQEARTVPGEHGAALRYALGGEREPVEIRVSFLLAAARSRQPTSEIAELHGRRGAVGPDGAVPASYHWRVKATPKQFAPIDERELLLDLEVTPPEGHVLATYPTVLLHRHRAIYFGNAGLEIRWCASVWPHHTDALYALGAQAIVARLNNTASPYCGNAAYLERLFDADAPLSEMAQLLLAVALVSRDADVAGLAVDALLQTVADGRCVGSELGRIYSRLISSELVKGNRLAKSLETVARASLLHTQVCAEIVQSALAPASALPRDGHHLLAVLHEWLVALDQPLAPGMRTLLDQANVSGKTAILARKLVQRNGPRNLAISKTIVQEALRGRIDRALQWMHRTASAGWAQSK